MTDIEYYRLNRKSTLLQTANGCENTCIFCQRKGWHGCYVPHSDDYVLNELGDIKNQGFRNVWIIDENFTYNLCRAKRLLKHACADSITKDMNLFVSSWANIDAEFLDLAANNNIRIISFGIETGNKNILTYYRKNICLDNVPKLIAYANKLGIFTVGNFILGAPMESDNTIAETFDFIRMCQFDKVNIKTLDYMIGSDLFNALDIKLKRYDHVFASKENGLTSFPLKKLIELKEEFKRQYYNERKNALAEKIRRFGLPYE